MQLVGGEDVKEKGTLEDLQLFACTAKLQSESNYNDTVSKTWVIKTSQSHNVVKWVGYIDLLGFQQ